MVDASFWVILSLLYGGMTKQELTHGNGQKWSYDGGTGPYHVSKDSVCQGVNQSPIDITSSTTVYDKLLRPLVFTQIASQKPIEQTIIINHGHTVSLLVPDVWILRGSNLDGQYKAVEVSFHWGKEGDKGSEHSLNGIKHDMELQIVHFAEKYGNLEDAIKHEDGIVIVAVFLDLTDNDNVYLTNIIDSVSDVRKSGQMSSVENFQITDLLPRDTAAYYQYDGSFTNPPCYENVQWFIMRNSIDISYNQIYQFYQLQTQNRKFSKLSETLKNIARSQQRLNDRVIRCSVPELLKDKRDIKNVAHYASNMRNKRAVKFRFSKSGPKSFIFSQAAPFSFSQKSANSATSPANKQVGTQANSDQTVELQGISHQASPSSPSVKQARIRPRISTGEAQVAVKKAANEAKKVERKAKQIRNIAKKTLKSAKKAQRRGKKAVEKRKNEQRRDKKATGKAKDGQRRGKKAAKNAIKTPKKVRNAAKMIQKKARRGDRTTSTSDAKSMTNDPVDTNIPVGGLTNIQLGQNIDLLNIGKFMGPAKPITTKMNTEIKPIPVAYQPEIYDKGLKHNNKVVRHHTRTQPISNSLLQVQHTSTPIGVKAPSRSTGQDPNAWIMTKSWSSGKAGEAKPKHYDVLHENYRPVNTVPPISGSNINNPNKLLTSSIQSYVIPIHKVPPPAPTNDWTNLNEVGNPQNRRKHPKPTPTQVRLDTNHNTGPTNSPGIPINNMEAKQQTIPNLQTFWNSPAQVKPYNVDAYSTTVSPSVTQKEPFIIPEAFLSSQNNWVGKTTIVPIEPSTSSPHQSYNTMPYRPVKNSWHKYKSMTQSGTPPQLTSVSGSIALPVQHTTTNGYQNTPTPSPIDHRELPTTQTPVKQEGQRAKDLKLPRNVPSTVTPLSNENQNTNSQYEPSYYMKNIQPRLVRRQNVFSLNNNLFSTKRPGKKTEFSILGKKKHTNKQREFQNNELLVERKEVSKPAYQMDTGAQPIHKTLQTDKPLPNVEITLAGATGGNNSVYEVSVQGEPLASLPAKSQTLSSQRPPTTQEQTKSSFSKDTSTFSVPNTSNNSSDSKLQTKDAVNWFVDKLHNTEFKTNYKELWSIFSNSIMKQKSETVAKSRSNTRELNDMNTISNSMGALTPEMSKSSKAQISTVEGSVLENIQPQYSEYVEPPVISQSIKKTYKHTNPPTNPIYHQQSYSTVHPGGRSVVSVAMDKRVEGTLSLYNPYDISPNNNDPGYIQQSGMQNMGSIQQSRSVEAIQAQPDILDRTILPNKQTHPSYPSNRMPVSGSQNINQPHLNYPPNRLEVSGSQNLNHPHSNYPSNHMQTQGTHNFEQIASHYPPNNHHLLNQGPHWRKPPRQEQSNENRGYQQYQATAKPDYTKPMVAHSTLYHRLQFKEPSPTTTESPPHYVPNKKRPVVFSTRFKFESGNKRPVFNGGRGSSNAFSATSVLFKKESSFQSNPQERYPQTVLPRSGGWTQNSKITEPPKHLVPGSNYWDRPHVQLIEKTQPSTPDPRQRTFLDRKLGVSEPFSVSTVSPIHYNYPVDTKPSRQNNYALKSGQGNPTRASNIPYSGSALNGRSTNIQYPLQSSMSQPQNSAQSKESYPWSQHTQGKQQYHHSQSLLKSNTFPNPTVSPTNASPNQPYHAMHHQQPTSGSSIPKDNKPNLKMEMTFDQPPKQAARTQFTNNPIYNLPQNQNSDRKTAQNRNSETPSFYTLGIGSKHLAQDSNQNPYERLEPKQKLPFVSISQSGNSSPSQHQQNFAEPKNIGKTAHPGTERPFIDKPQKISPHSQIPSYPSHRYRHPTTASLPALKNNSSKDVHKYQVPTWQPTRQPTPFPLTQTGQVNMMQPVVNNQNQQPWNHQSNVAEPQQKFQQNPTPQSLRQMQLPSISNLNINKEKTNPLKYKFPAKFDWLKGNQNQFYKTYETTVPPTTKTTPTTTQRRPAVDPAAIHASVSGYGPLLIFG